MRADMPAPAVDLALHFGAIVAFLCSEHVGYLTGAEIHVDGGTYQALL